MGEERSQEEIGREEREGEEAFGRRRLRREEMSARPRKTKERGAAEGRRRTGEEERVDSYGLEKGRGARRSNVEG